jgi:hypothetical protein
MKNFFLIFVLSMSFALSICAQNNGSNTTQQGSKHLIVFYSWSGNSRSIANNLHSIVGGDIVEITPATPYTSNYNQMLTVAQQEIAAINSGT